MKIMILEDDKRLCALVVKYLQNDFLIDVAHNIDDFTSYIEQFNYDAVLLDRDIDGEDIGLDMISFVKEKNPQTAVLVISAYGNVSDKINGLNLGADDYLEKPFDNEELLARIYAQIRRQIPQPTIYFDALKFDLYAQNVTYKDETLEFSKKESDLLFYLLKHLNKIVSPDELMNALYLHPEEVGSSTIRVTVKNIRNKLPLDIIKTVKTRGYVIEKR